MFIEGCSNADCWWRGIAVSRCVKSTKLLYDEPG